jgi:hypothetical protein
MGLARNLRKILKESVNLILVELSSVFIKRRAKLILKKQDNSSTTTSSSKSLTQESPDTTIVTSSADTTEKITMDELTTEQLVDGIRTWAIDRFDMEKMPIGDCRALYEEFADWIEPQGEELEIVSLEQITPEEFERYRQRT